MSVRYAIDLFTYATVVGAYMCMCVCMCPCVAPQSGATARQTDIGEGSAGARRTQGRAQGDLVVQSDVHVTGRVMSCIVMFT